MNWISMKSWEYQKQAKECWHFWFAWYPVVVKKYPDGAVKKVWLRVVKRKGMYKGIGHVGWVYTYKEI